MWPRISFVGSMFAVLIFILLFSIYLEKNLTNGDTGVLVLAHGGGPEWDKAVTEAVMEARGGFPREIVFGMGDAEKIQTAINKFEKSGIKAIVVVPLFLSSSSELYRQLEYVLRLRDEPDALFTILMKEKIKEGGHHAKTEPASTVKQVRFSVPFVLTKAINYDPLIASILAERIGELNLVPSYLSVFLVAHGPVSGEDNKDWMISLRLYARNLSKQIKGVSVLTHTIRDDAPSFIKEMAQEIIIKNIREEKGKGREVAVIPFLLAPGGREEEIKRIFSECECRILAKTLLPHPNISLWIEQQIQTGKKKLHLPN